MKKIQQSELINSINQREKMAIQNIAMQTKKNNAPYKMAGNMKKSKRKPTL